MSSFATKTSGTRSRRGAAFEQRPNLGVLGILLFLVSLSTDALGQPTASSASKAKIPEPTKLALKKDPHVERGTVVAVQSTADERGQRFLIEGLDILQPVGVVLLAKDKSHELHVQLSKFGDKTPAREATTNGEGRAIVRLRTQGDLAIAVKASSSQTVPFGLIVWAGEEQEAALKDVVVPLNKS